MNKLQIEPYEYSEISKWRSQLMGIGILGVMLAHYFNWTDTHGTLSLVCKPFIGLVFTEGFLFLSGYGLFYSFAKTPDRLSFWCKRVNRFWIPFAVIYLPYAVFSVVVGGNLWKNLLELFTLRYWFYGNAGLWYISVTALLYVLFPFIYRYISNVKFISRCFLLVAIFYVLAVIVYFIFPSYYEMINEGLTQMPCFIWGILAGYLSYNKKNLKQESFLFGILVVVTIIFNLQEGILGDFGDGFLRIVCILIISPIFSIFANNRICKLFLGILNYLGTVTLELYVLHMLFYNVLCSYKYGAELSVIIPIVVSPFVHKLLSRDWIKKTNSHAV